MSRTSCLLAAAMASLAVNLISPAAAAIVLGQVDDFEDGTEQGWGSGPQNPNGPVNVASGGPAGANDRYLRLSATGAFGPGGKLVAFNGAGAQWTGDYLGAGITAIQMQVNNLGDSDLVLRLILEPIGPGLSTATPVNVAAGSGWRTVSFSLASGNLTGPGNYDSVLADVHEITLLHSPTAVPSRGPSVPRIAAVLGIDNVTAVPEPSTWVLAALGLLLVIGRAARRLTTRL